MTFVGAIYRKTFVRAIYVNKKHLKNEQKVGMLLRLYNHRVGI